MGTTADKLQHLADTKELIKTAIQGKGQGFYGTETFRDYATKIGNISKECTAVASNILSGKTAYSGGSKITGTISSKGAQTYSPSTSAQTISSGQYLSGTQTISAVTGTAGVGEVLSGKTFASGNGVGLTGTMTNRGAVTSTITTQGGQYTVPSGYHSGSGKITASFANLSAGNIKSGVNVGGVVGTLSPIQSRTVNISLYSQSLSTWSISKFCLLGGDSKLVDLTNTTYSAIPTSIVVNGDILTFYGSGAYSRWVLFATASAYMSGAELLYSHRIDVTGWAYQIQVFKLTSTNPSLTLSYYTP